MIRPLPFAIVILLATIVSTPVQAAWTAPLTVTGGFVEDSDAIIIYTSEATQYVAGCPGGRFNFVAVNDDRRGRAWATVLTALTAGRKIQLWYTNICSSSTYVDVSAIQIQ